MQNEASNENLEIPMTSDTQKARELLDAAYTFLDGKIASDSRYREAFKAGCCAPFEADRLTEFAAHVTAQKDAEIAEAKHLASAFGETITNIAVKVLGLSDPNLPGDGADWDSDKTFSESVIESFAALRAQAEKDKAEIERMQQLYKNLDTHLSERNDDAEQRIVKLEEALRKIEWVLDPELGDTFCPACGRLSEFGHCKDCGLNAVLPSLAFAQRGERIRDAQAP
jgi:hypothetical protein